MSDEERGLLPRTGKVLAAVALLGLLAACVAGSSDSQQAAQDGPLSQFLLGLWHGVIAPFTLIGEVINNIAPSLLPWQVGFFESAGRTYLYDIGFYFGIAAGPPIVISRWPRRRA